MNRNKGYSKFPEFYEKRCSLKISPPDNKELHPATVYGNMIMEILKTVNMTSEMDKVNNELKIKIVGKYLSVKIHFFKKSWNKGIIEIQRRSGDCIEFGDLINLIINHLLEHYPTYFDEPVYPEDGLIDTDDYIFVNPKEIT